MKNLISFLLFLEFLFSSCNTDKNQSLLNKAFTSKDIKQIDILVKAFEERVAICCPGNDTEKSLTNFFEILFKDDSRTDSFMNKLDSIFPINIRQNIINSMDKEVLTKIWLIKNKDDSKTLCEIEGLHLKGDYFALLKSISNDNQLIKEYVTAITNAGDISPFCYNLFRERQIELNINDPVIRLILAVHYFSFHRNL